MRFRCRPEIPVAVPLFPAAMRSLDVRAFDVVISNSHAIAKNVRTHERQLHICYCLSPMRYAWDLREQYLAESGLDSGMRGIAARTMLGAIKAMGPRVFGGCRCIRHAVALHRGSHPACIRPLVRRDLSARRRRVLHAGSGDPTMGDYYVTVSRFVPYKRID